MFNVSTLLLHYAFKPATPLATGVINETLRQFCQLSNISQSVATHLRCDGIFSDVISPPPYCKFYPDSDSETISKIG